MSENRTVGVSFFVGCMLFITAMNLAGISFRLNQIAKAIEARSAATQCGPQGESAVAKPFAQGKQ